MYRIWFICIVCLFFMGCIPKDQLLRSRDIQRVEVGLAADKKSDRLLSSDQAVDEFSKVVTRLMKEKGFRKTHSSVSWGLQPLTGHTQNLSFKTPGNEYVYCSVTISKTEFTAIFRELERKPQSLMYETTTKDKEHIEQVVRALNELAKEKFKGRATRISIYDNQTSPNKENAADR